MRPTGPGISLGPVRLVPYRRPDANGIHWGIGDAVLYYSVTWAAVPFVKSLLRGDSAGDAIAKAGAAAALGAANVGILRLTGAFPGAPWAAKYLASVNAGMLDELAEGVWPDLAEAPKRFEFKGPVRISTKPGDPLVRFSAAGLLAMGYTLARGGEFDWRQTALSAGFAFRMDRDELPDWCGYALGGVFAYREDCGARTITHENTHLVDEYGDEVVSDHLFGDAIGKFPGMRRLWEFDKRLREVELFDFHVSPLMLLDGLNGQPEWCRRRGEAIVRAVQGDSRSCSSFLFLPEYGKPNGPNGGGDARKPDVTPPRSDRKALARRQ